MIDEWKVRSVIWPNQTPLEERLEGKRHHHDIHCNVTSRHPMGSYGCSCFYNKGRRLDQDGKPRKV